MFIPSPSPDVACFLEAQIKRAAVERVRTRCHIKRKRKTRGRREWLADRPAAGGQPEN